MTPRVDQERKLSLLNFIKSKKSILFGKFSSDLANREKVSAWKEVLLKAKSLEIVNNSRDAAFVRDKVYGVWKSRTLEKNDNKCKTGSKGGKENVLNEVDHLILDIIGKKTVIAEGLPVGESGRPMTINQKDEADETNLNYPLSSHSPTLPYISNISLTQSSNNSIQTPVQNRAIKRRHVSQTNTKDAELELKRKQLQVDLLEVQVYNQRLIAMKMEKDLNLPISVLTCCLFGQNSEIYND